MRDDLLRELEADYELRRAENEREEQRRKQFIAEHHPAIAALAQQREELIYSSLRGIVQGQASADNLPERMEALSANIREELRGAHLPEDYLAPVERCALCHDTGYVGNPVKEPCSCLRASYQAKLRSRLGLPEDNRETFECYSEDILPGEPLPGQSFSQRKLMGMARDRCERFADRYPNTPEREILLSGESGLGKTFLLRAMATRLLERDVPILLISAYDFLQEARKDAFGEESALPEMLSIDVLMIDDLGSEPLVQNISIEQLFRLVNTRKNHGLATIISTNLSLADFRKRYTERISSRLTDSTTSLFIPLAGTDLRRINR